MPALNSFLSRYFAVIDRYLLKEFVFNLIAVTGILWFIFIATRFARYLAQVAGGKLSSDIIFTLLGYSSIGAFSILLPIAAFFALMLALGRLNSDSELTVIAACGIPNSRVYRDVLIFSGFVAAIVAILSLSVVPEVLSGRYQLEQEAKIAADTRGLVAGQFKESRDGDWIFYTSGFTEDKARMKDLFIEIHRGERPMVFRAETGHFEIDDKTGNRYLVMEDGLRYTGQAGDKDFVIAQFEQHDLLIEEGTGKHSRERRKARSSMKLWQAGEDEDLAELQWRFSTVIMTIILALYAVELSKTGPRKGRYAAIFPAVIVYIIYSNLLGVNKAWIAKGVISPIIGSVWIHLLMIILLLLFYHRQKTFQRLTQYRKTRGKAA